MIHFHHPSHYNTNRQRKQVLCRNFVSAISPLRMQRKAREGFFPPCPAKSSPPPREKDFPSTEGIFSTCPIKSGPAARKGFPKHEGGFFPPCPTPRTAPSHEKRISQARRGIFSPLPLTAGKKSAIIRSTNGHRGVAQLVARDVWDVDAAGSNPVTPTISSVHNRFKLWTLDIFLLMLTFRLNIELF